MSDIPVLPDEKQSGTDPVEKPKARPWWLRCLRVPPGVFFEGTFTRNPPS